MSNYANSGTTTPLAPCEPRRVTMPISHLSEQDTLPTISLISKQVVPYRTRDDTCCPEVSTPMTWSLADSSMTNHITWWILTVSTIPNLAQTTASNLTMVTSTQVKLNIIKIERLIWWLKTAGLSITTNHKNPILNYECLVNQLIHAASVY
jgi:hypothetical protein